MRRRPATFTFAFCASLVAHAGLMTLVAWWFVRSSGRVHLAALPRPEPTVVPILSSVPPAPPPRTPPPPPPAAATPPPPALPKEDFDQATKTPLRDDSGETDTHGTANRSTPGDRPMQAHEGLEQANLRRNERPEAPRLSDADFAAQTGMKNPTTPGDTPPPSFGVPAPSPQPRDPNAGRQRMIAIADASAAPAPPVGNAAPVVATLGTQAGKLDQSPSARPPVEPTEVQGHASLSSDTDSEAFANANSAEFRDGRLTARQGRRVRTTHIDFGLSASAAAMAVADPTVVLGVRVDSAGDVQNVVILHSSGSPNIDLPCQRSVYNWWFEPKKDKNGRPAADLWVVTIE